MNSNTKKLLDLGQSLWLDNLSREMLASGELQRLIRDHGLTGLTSNPTIFEKAMGEGGAYDDAIAGLARAGRSTEDLFFALAIEDLRAAADLFRPAHERSGGVDGWVSLELSPTLQHDTLGSVQAAAALHAQAARRNLYIKIPGTREGAPAIEEAIFRGVPVNVTLLFSREHYLTAAEAYMRGIERRLNDGKLPVVESVASLFVSRWDAAVHDRVPEALRNRLGIAIGQRCYKAYRDLLASGRWKSLAAAGAHPQRLLFASTGTKDPAASATLYVAALAAPDTVDTLPGKTLEAFGKGGEVKAPLREDGGDCEAVLAQFTSAGIDLDALAAQLQKDGGDAFLKSWNALLAGLRDKVEKLVPAR